ncbi:MAG: DUF2797 domain-containing protein [Promethearchaeota archaeon]
MHVLEVHWRLHGPQNYEPGYLFWTDNDDVPHFASLVAKKEISWTIRGPRRCVGSIDSEGRRRKCPEMAVVGPGRRRCATCSLMDIMDPCIRCDGKDCKATERRLESCNRADYAVYLAVFNDSTLKVGVSKEARLVTRWVEQGADFGGVIARVRGGRRARQLEYQLSRSPEVTRQVRGIRKESLLLGSLEEEKAQSIAQDFLNSVETPEVDSTTDLVNLSSYYKLSELHAEPHRWNPKGTKLDGLQILGEVVGMKGSLLVTRIDESFSVLNLGILEGYTIDEDARISVVSQTGILDFS